MSTGTYPVTLYYDSACPLCDTEMHNLMLRNQAVQLHFEDVQAPGFTCPEGVTREALLTLMHARTASGQWLSGVAAFEVAYTAAGLGWVMAPARIPLLRKGMNALYPVIARNRYRAPAWVIRMFFGKTLRRAAERAAAQQCTDQCMLDRLQEGHEGQHGRDGGASTAPANPVQAERVEASRRASTGSA
ncbi:thiol-disulfide oxidoreductase DCC family protein [Acidovorax sp. BL-A-41-H1]|uniref:thiol-disulfide oxidoreductase DCC family protein n=1 Tax=Acidovorax sp. BL-A-41-H1 TaxID=3421102 RepID=UPI003F7A7A7F